MKQHKFRWIWQLILVFMIAPQRLVPAAESTPPGPHIVMIIRHAEKPTQSGDPNLSKKGYERADALATVIPAHFPKPDYLFATKKTKGSNRPVETITPLGKALGEPIDSDFKDDDVTDLAREVLTDRKLAGQVILIAWHHEKIPALAKALGVKDAPDKWSSSVFDRVWEITYDDNVATFKDLPQEALPGDSTK